MTNKQKIRILELLRIQYKTYCEVACSLYEELERVPRNQQESVMRRLAIVEDKASIILDIIQALENNKR